MMVAKVKGQGHEFQQGQCTKSEKSLEIIYYDPDLPNKPILKSEQTNFLIRYHSNQISRKKLILSQVKGQGYI